MQNLIAQKSLTILAGSTPLYTFSENKIYKGNSTRIIDLAYTYSNHKIYKDSSNRIEDAVLSINEGKVYRGGAIRQDSMIFYVKQNIIYLKTKNGDFKSAGFYNPKDGGSALLTYLEDLETVAFYIIVYGLE
jgi:hypothetical protein